MSNMDEVRRRHAAAEDGGGVERRERQHREGKLSARERIDLLLDEGSFEETGKLVRHRCRDFGMESQTIDGDGFVTGYGVEVAMLIDVYRTVGLGGMVEADMGAVNNRWKPDDALGDVMREVTAGAMIRGVSDGCTEPASLPDLKQRPN